MNAKIYRVSGFLIDRSGTSSIEDVDLALRQFLCANRHMHIEEAELPITDENVLIDENCDLADCQKYFNNEISTGMTSREVKVGETYRHFKGKTVKVIAISQDSEVPGRFNVVYTCETGCFNRPYDMFISEVDHKKYPNVEQKYRFEKVED